MGATNELTGSISANKMVKKTGKEIKSRAEEQLCIERVEEHVTNKTTFRLRSEWWEASSVKSGRAMFMAERPQGLRHWGGVSKGVKDFFLIGEGTLERTVIDWIEDRGKEKHWHGLPGISVSGNWMDVSATTETENRWNKS